MAEARGADAGRLSFTARKFEVAAERLSSIRASLDTSVHGADWHGADAEAVRLAWRSTLSAELGRVAGECSGLARRLHAHASEQERASANDPAAHHPDSSPSHDPSGLRRPGRRDDETRGDGSSRFPQSPDGRAAVLLAMHGLSDPDRIGFDEIELRSLDNGRYIVVLPGVTDLSDGVARFTDVLRGEGPLAVHDAVGQIDRYWDDNDAPTVRKMQYAIDAARGRDDDVYAAVVLDALERADVPAGADVLLIGHSYGAYAAMSLASERALSLIHI